MIQQIKNYYHLMQARRASARFAYPQKYLKIIGVTGTDGKTTTTSLIFHILRTCGFKVGYISTTGAKIGDKELDTGLHVTSPDPWDVPRYLRMMVDSDIEYVILESTSQGLDQNRFGDIKFDAAVVTNIREDHLDYHKTWQNYAKAKFKLLEKLKSEGLAILNADDDSSAEWLKENLAKLKQNIYAIWTSKHQVTNVKQQIELLEFTYKNTYFSIPIFGADHNIENTLQAIQLCESVVGLAQIQSALNTYKSPSGRMEPILADPIKILVDFAHTPAALEHTLLAVRKMLPKDKRLITVFGCAGRRDRGRRQMGEVSAKLSDISILTAEDPRNEKLADINSEILNTAKPYGGSVIDRFVNHEDYNLTSLGEIHAKLETAWKQGFKPFIVFDEDNRNSRRDAIEIAIRLARRGDCIVLTGKGHEQSLAFGPDEKEFSWSDQTEAKSAIKRLRII